MDFENTLTAKWSKEILDKGFTAVPNLLIEYRKHLGISVTDFYVLLAIEEHRWDNTQKPWPSLKTLSELTNLSVRTVSRSTSNLEELGLIVRIHRTGTSNKYDLSPLIEELDDIAINFALVTIPSDSSDQLPRSDMTMTSGHQ